MEKLNLKNKIINGDSLRELKKIPKALKNTMILHMHGLMNAKEF